MIGIIPAAGKGTRLRELGRLYPKSILPVNERPLLVWNVEWLRGQGCDEIVVVANHQKEAIEEVIEIYGLDVAVVDVEIEGGGLSQSVLAGLNGSKRGDDQSALILLGDLKVKGGSVDKENNSVSTFTVDDWSRWCLIGSDGTFYDKPEDRPPTQEALSGVYHILSTDEFKGALETQLREGTKIRGEYQISTALSMLKSAVKSFSLEILDFGTLSDFLNNRGLRNSRSFNRVSIAPWTVTKLSEDREKIISEVNWYRNIPNDIKLQTPRILESDIYGSKGASYEMERILDPTLRELFLFLDRDPEMWSRIFTECHKTLRQMSQWKSDRSSASSLLSKTTRRIEEGGFMGSQKVQDFLWEFEQESKKYETYSCLVHGDFCFSNLMWNNTENRITMLDPRGEIFYSPWYDWAKFRHSILYGYDAVDSQLYSVSDLGVKMFDAGTEEVRDLYREVERGQFSEGEIRYLDLLTASLFISMIPLHSHNSQNQELFYEKFEEIWANLQSDTRG